MQAIRAPYTIATDPGEALPGRLSNWRRLRGQSALMSHRRPIPHSQPESPPTDDFDASHPAATSPATVKPAHTRPATGSSTMHTGQWSLRPSEALSNAGQPLSRRVLVKSRLDATDTRSIPFYTEPISIPPWVNPRGMSRCVSFALVSWF